MEGDHVMEDSNLYGVEREEGGGSPPPPSGASLHPPRRSAKVVVRRGDFEEEEEGGEEGERPYARQPLLLEPLGRETMVSSDDCPSGIPSTSTSISTSSTTGSPSGTNSGSSSTSTSGYVRHSVYGVTFELPLRYAPPLEALGRGGYGFVASALDATTQEPVAVKKISTAFRDVMDAKRVLREVVIQRHMEHPNIASIRDVIRPPRPRLFKDVYIVYDLMPSDLQQVIQSDQPLSEKHFKYMLVQLLRGLRFLHSARVLHRDLKPANVLVDDRCHVKITDFGLARTVLGREGHMTEYVVTRWYRAPELLLNCQKHTAAIDVWALGCIYMELVARQVWIKGHAPLDQLRKTVERIGSPSIHDLGFLENDDARKYLMLQVPHTRRPFVEQCPMLTPLGADLAEKMLMFDPNKRITVDEALAHPYLAQYYDPTDNLICESPFEYDLSFEQSHFTVPLIRQLIYEVACDFNPTPAPVQ